MIIYDTEIARCIPAAGEAPTPSLAFCQGWEDFPGMGISCVCAWIAPPGLYRVWMARADGLARPDDFAEFAALAAEADTIIGFNSISFDDRLLEAHGIAVRTTYDLLQEVRHTSGQPREYVAGVTRSGYNLDALAQANGLPPKSGRGDLAPVLWQTGRIGELVDYCLRDVQITRALYERRFNLIDPTSGKRLHCVSEEDLQGLEESIVV